MRSRNQLTIAVVLLLLVGIATPSGFVLAMEKPADAELSTAEVNAALSLLGPNTKPSFTPGFGWQPHAGVGSGLNADETFPLIFKMEIKDDIIYVIGDFNNAGGDPDADGLAKWESGAWSSVGGGGITDPEFIRDFEFDGDDLYVVGDFGDIGGSGAENVAKFDGTSWSALDSCSWADGDRINTIEISLGAMYIGGYFKNACGDADADNIAQYNGTEWESLGGAGTGIGTGNETVFNILVPDTGLWAGTFLVAGGFSNVGGSCGDGVVQYFAGAWNCLGGGVNVDVDGGAVLGLVIDGFNIYAYGSFEDVVNANGDYIVRYNSGTWYTMGSGLLTGNGWVSKVVVHNGVVYAGGIFVDGGGDPYADNFAKFGATNWVSIDGEESHLDNAWVTDFTFLSDESILVVGGFRDDGFSPDMEGIALYGPVPVYSSNPEPDAKLSFKSGDLSKEIEITNTGGAGKGLDVDLDSISAGYSVTGLPISSLMNGDPAVILTVECAGVPQANGELKMTSNDPAATTIIYELTCVDPPGVAVLQSPANGELVNSLRPTLDWNNPTGWSYFQVQVSKQANLSSPIINQNNVMTSQYKPTADLQPNTTYFWRVRTYNVADEASAFSVIRSFKTPISAPNLTQPANGSTGNSPTPLFKWQVVSGADSYQLQVSRKANMSSPLLTESGITKNSFALEDALKGGLKYYWRVRGKSASGFGAWSSVFSFTTGVGTPELLTPVHGSTTNAKPTFDWKDVPGATSYTLRIQSKSTVILEVTITKSIYKATVNLPPTTYNWLVRAIGPQGPGEWSGKFTFTVK